MSNVIDERVVEMRFDNKQFESGVQTSMGTLQRLKDALNFNKSAQALDGLTNAFNRADFSGLSNALYSIQDGFSTFGIIGMTALQNLTNTALNLGNTLLHKVMSPLNAIPNLIKEGGKQRAMNIQQARFMMEGLKLDFDEFNTAIDNAVTGTRFGYDEAALAASQLATAGVGAADMEKHLRAISGVAAMTNSEYSDMARIFTQVASRGKLTGEAVESLSTRGLNVVHELAKELDTTDANIKDMISKGKISYAQFSETMFKSFADQAKRADETLTGVTANIRAAWKRIGQEFWLPIVENNSAYVKALQKMKTLVKDYIKPATDEAAHGGWKEFINLLVSGLDAILSYQPLLDGLLRSVRGVFTFIGSFKINDRIKAAYKDIGELVKRMERFKETFKTISSFLNGDISKDSAISSVFGKYADFAQFDSIFEKYANNVERIQNVIKGAQSAFHIFTSFLSAVGTGFSKLLSHIFPATDGFLSFSSSIAENITQLDEWLTENDVFNKAIETVDKYVGPVLDFLVEKFNDLTESFRKNGPKFADITGTLSKLGEGIRNVFKGIWDVIQNVTPYIKKAFDWIGEVLSGLGESIGEFFKNLDFNTALGALGAGGGLGVLITIFSKVVSFIEGIKSAGQGGFNIWIMLGQLRDILMGYQTSINASVLKEIAVSIGILAGSLFVLSLIDTDKLAAGVTALGAIMTEFFFFLEAFSKINGSVQEVTKTANNGNFITGLISGFFDKLSYSVKSIGDAAKKIGQGASIVAIAGAILILAFAVKKLGEINVADAIQGVVAVGVLFKELEIFLNKASLDKISVKTGTGILLAAASIVVLSKAVQMLGDMDIGALIQGGIAVGVLMTFMDVFLKYLTADDKKFVSAGVGMIAFAAAMIVLAKAVYIFGTMNPEEMGQGLLGIALGLTVMVGALHFLDAKNIIGKVAGLLILAATLHVLAGAVEKMGSIPIDSMGQGLTGIMVALAGLVIALDLLDGKDVIAKAAAITIMSFALNKIAISIIKLGAMSPERMGLALLTLAGAFVILAAAGYLLAPVAATISILSDAMFKFGLGIALIGGGIFLLGAGLMSISAGLVAFGAAFATAGVEIVAGITAIVSGIIMGIAASATALAEGFVTFLVAIGNGANQLIPVVVQLGTAIITGLTELIDQIIEFVANLIIAILQALIDAVPKLGELITTAINEVLRILVEAVPAIVEAAGQMIYGFLDGITNEIPQIIVAAFQLVITFLNSMASAIDEHGPELITAFNNLIGSVIHFLAEAAFQFLWAAIEWIAQLVMGIVDGIGDVVTGFSDLCVEAVNCVGDFVKDFVEAGANLVAGIIEGIGLKAKELWDSITGMAQEAWNRLKSAWDEKSPSKLTAKAGEWFDQGIVVGIKHYANKVYDSVTDLGENTYDALKDTLGNIDDVVNGEVNLNPTITPVMDLSSIQEGAGTLNGMFGTTDLSSSLTVGAKLDNVGAIMSLNSKWNTFSNGDVVNSINELHNDISDLNTRIEEMNDKDATYEFNLNTQLDGRNIARSTARYNKKELALLDRNSNRKGGKV